MRRFTLTEAHIKLLRRMQVGWQHVEGGAPAIDPKRPYGNGDMIRDICEILQMEPKTAAGDDEHPAWHGWDRRAARNLHNETDRALQIVLATGTFEPGEYVADDYRENWRRA